MFNFTTVVFDGTSPTFYFTNTSGWNTKFITDADAHTSAASSLLNWRPRRLKWTRPCRRKTKSGFCACAITFQTQSTLYSYIQCLSSYD